MTDRLVIERLEFEGFVGIEERERSTPQPLAIDLELFFDFSRASSTDDLKDTVDYAAVAKTIVATAKGEQSCSMAASCGGASLTRLSVAAWCC